MADDNSKGKVTERRMYRTITPDGIICDIAEGTTYAALVAMKKRLEERIAARQAEQARRDNPTAPELPAKP
jgi:hypothetical protein